MNTQLEINVAPSSTAGHYVKNAIKVLNLDAVNETFLVEGPHELVTLNHTSLKMKEDKCLITTQKVYNPLTKMLEKSKD